MRKIFLAIALSVCALGVGAQVKFEPGYYASPMEGPMLLSANFAEMRPNHFHSGVDIKTGGAEGKIVRAIADGYISRIGIAPWGFGRTIYITHPNGTTSVYAHLKSFNSNLEKHMADERYRIQKHWTDIYLTPDKYPVKKGERIALSGNSGMSFGPHLHFEIREAASQAPVNIVQKKLLPVKDNIRPTIVQLHYFEVDTVRGVPVYSGGRKIAVKSAGGGKYTLADTSALEIGPRGYFALEATDRKNDTHNTMGVYRVTQRFDGQKTFEFTLDKFLFANTRYVNSLSVYPMQRASKNEIIRLAQQENNTLPIYRYVQNRGLVRLHDQNRHTVEIEVEDDNGNLATLEFDVVRRAIEKPFYSECDVDGQVIDAKTTFNGGRDGVSVSIPAKALYESMFYMQKIVSLRPEQKGNRTILSDVLYSVMSTDVPLHSNITLSIAEDVPENMRSKAFIATLSDKGAWSYVGGKYANGRMTTKTRSFGLFAIALDTTAPTVTPSFRKGANLAASNSIGFTINDDFSGVDEFTGWIDGKWILFEYDVIKKRITHNFDDKRTPKTGGKHTLKLVVRDNCANVRTYTSEFIR